MNVLYFESMSKDQLLQYIVDEHKKAKYLKILEKESLDIEKVYQTSLDLMINLENVDMAFIYMIDHRNNNAVLKAHINAPEDYIRKAGVIPYPKGVTWKVLSEKKVLNLYDIQEDKDIGEAGKTVGHRRALGIPIVFDKTIMGVIWLASYKRGKFSEQEIEFNCSVANHIGLTVARAKLYDDLAKSNRYHNIVSKITTCIHQSLNPNEVMKNIVEALVNNIENVDNAAIYMLEDEEVVLKVHNDLPEWFVMSVKRITNKKGFIWKTISEGHFIYVSDADNDTVMGPAGKKLGIKSYVSIPITDETKNIGAISITSSFKNVFDEQDIDLLKTVTKQIEIAIKNAQRAEEIKLAYSKLELRVEERTAQLKVINEELHRLAMHMQSIREEEILKISRELHDDLGQLLTGLNIEFSNFANKLQIKNNSNSELEVSEVCSIKKIIRSAIQKVQKISIELRPAILDTLGLIPAIEWHVEEFKTRTGIECEFDSNLNGMSFDDKESIAIYRILQESLTNIIRHAQATKVNISIYKQAGSIILEIIDNGVGIQKNNVASAKSIGLQGMRERAIVLGGELSITGNPRSGTDIKLSLPL